MGYYEDLAKKKAGIPKNETPAQRNARLAKAAIGIKNVLKATKYNPPPKRQG